MKCSCRYLDEFIFVKTSCGRRFCEPDVNVSMRHVLSDHVLSWDHTGPLEDMSGQETHWGFIFDGNQFIYMNRFHDDS